MCEPIHYFDILHLVIHISPIVVLREFLVVCLCVCLSVCYWCICSPGEIQVLIVIANNDSTTEQNGGQRYKEPSHFQMIESITVEE